MKKFVLTAAVLGFVAMSTTVVAQDENTKEKDKEKKSQEIIIRKKGDKDTKITVEIKGDNVTINGKPMSEFKDDDVIVNRRNVTIRNARGGKNWVEGSMEPFTTFGMDMNATPHAFLGVTTEEVEDGARITEISKESAAEKAGLKTGDIITKVGDKKVDGPESLYDAVTAMKPKDEAKIYYKRDGKENSLKAILGESKISNAMAYSFSSPDGYTRSFNLPRTPYTKAIPKIEMWNDKELREMTPRIYTPDDYNGFNYSYGDLFRQHKLGLKIQDTEDGTGVKVLDVDKDSPAEKAGLKKDDVVTEIGGKKVSNTDEVREQLHDVMEKSSYNVKAKRNNSEMSFDIRIPKKLKTANL